MMTPQQSNTVYAIGQEHHKSYASAYQEAPKSGYEICSTCRRVLRRSSMLRGELTWLETTRGRKCHRGELGDFTWHGRADEALISDRLKNWLKCFLAEHPVSEVAYENNFELPNVNSGRPIWELSNLPFAHIDLKKTGAEVIHECDECDNKTFDFNREMLLVINRDTWNDWHFFSVEEFEMLFVSEEVLHCLRGLGATNFRVRRPATIG